MQATGIVRSVDTEGRMCIPKKLRRELKITPTTTYEIYVDGENILLRKYDPKYEVGQSC